MPSSALWSIGFIGATAVFCGVYWLAARPAPELRIARNFALLMLASCIASNLITWLLPYPEGIKLFAPMDLVTCYLAVRYRRGRRWLVVLAFAMLAMETLHSALWGPHLLGGEPGAGELGRYFAILDVLYVIACLIVAFPGGRHAYKCISAAVSSRRGVALQPLTRL